MGTTMQAGRAARPLAVLAVLLGLLAMHGLSSTHHAAASPAPPATAPATAPATGAGAHDHVVPLPAALHAAVAFAGGSSGSCDDHCPDLALLCVAVVAAAALALLLARRRSAPLLPGPARPRAPVPAPPVRHARRPDPVRELCVSRT